MKINQKSDIFVEFEPFSDIEKSPRKDDANFCSKCGTEVEFISISEAAVITDVEIAEILRKVTKTKWHLKKTDHGEFRICLNSLMKHGFRI